MQFLKLGAWAFSVPVVFGAVLALGCGSDPAPVKKGSGGPEDTAFTAKPWQLAEQCQPDAARDPGPSPMLRVTNFEYDNVVRDLQANVGLPVTVTNPSANVSPAPGPVTSLHVTAYIDAAKTIADQVAVPGVATFAGCTTQDAACGTNFVRNFGGRAFRRPLTDAEVTRYVAVLNLGLTKKGFSTGISMVAQAILNSAEFLYKPEIGVPQGDGSSKLTSWEIASRLSYYLWASAPDNELFAAAESGALNETAGILAQAQRMLDTRAKSEPAVAAFFDEWLMLPGISSIEKDATAFPKWNPTLAQAMETEAQLFSNQAFWQGLAVSDLFLASQSFLNKPLADFYGLTGPTGDEFVVTELDGVKRFGILTQGGFLASEAKTIDTNPVKRGKFVQISLLCGAVSPPPPGVEALFPEISPTATQRERFEQHSSDPACAGCHRYMDPIGLVFEHYSGIGEWRDKDAQGREYDVSGELIGTKDVDGPYNGVHELAEKLATSADTRSCVAAKWFEHARSRGLVTTDACNMKALLDGFSTAQFKLNSLALDVTKMDAFRYIRTVQGGS